MIDSPLIDWLLESQIPTIRYLTLTQLLGLAEADPEVLAARRAVQATGPIPAILAKQSESGAWRGEKSYYTPKYTSAHWSMLLLDELEADQADVQVRRGAAHMLEVIGPEVERRLGRGMHGWTCLWANILRYTVHAGLVQDPRLEIVIAALLRDGLDFGWRCPYNDERSCAWGAARALWGLAALPPDRRNAQIEASMLSSIRCLLEDHDLVRADYPTPAGGKIHDVWSRLNFPLFYQADILFVLRALADANALDHPGAQPALEWLTQRRKANGRWSGASPFRPRTWRVIGDRNEIDRWVSLQAAGVLLQAGY
jgi:hypothetical protein